MHKDLHIAGRVLLGVLAGATMLVDVGCATRARRDPYAPMSERDRQPSKADQFNLQSADLVDSDPKEAERLVREALSFDLYHGPAHNNLGVILLKQGKLYEAAGEFEWAKRLIPGHPNPRMNLALVFERAGKTTDAIAQYRAALEVAPEHTPTIQALVRLESRTGRDDPDFRDHLEHVALRGLTPQWRDWARLQLSKKPEIGS